MQTADAYDGETVYLAVDPWPSTGPIQYISGEEALAWEYDRAYISGLVVGIHNGTIEYVDNWYTVSLRSHISRARLTSVAAAIQVCRSMKSETWPERTYIHNGGGPVNHDLLDLDKRTFLEISDSGICARVEERYGARPSISRTDYKDMVESIAQKYGCHVSDVSYFTVDGVPIDDDGTPPPGYLLEGEDDIDPDYYADMVHVVDIRIEANDGDSAAGRLIQCGCAISDYLAAIRGRTFDAKTAVALLRGGHVDVLIGSEEGAYLEAKSDLYNIDAPGHTGDREKIELARDVARFANGDTDAILVIGYAEAKTEGRSELSALSPIDLTRFSAEQYQAVLDARIVPSITGLVVEQVPTGPDSGVAFIYVPRQPEEMQPYLVHGAIVGDKIEGSFFSIVQRRGEGSITVNASQIHGYIVAGKAFLRRDG